MSRSPRRRPLPWQTAKPAVDDAGAPERVAALLRSPSYTPGGEDPDFVPRSDPRSERLMMDYLKPELLLKAAGIELAPELFGERLLAVPETPAARAPLQSWIDGVHDMESVKEPSRTKNGTT